MTRIRRWWINRTICDVLEEMRTCHKVHNYGPLPSLIEEVQSMANRMEASLSNKRDLEEMTNEWHRLKKEIKQLRSQLPDDKSDVDD